MLEQKTRVDKLKQMTLDKIEVNLASDAAVGMTGQIFAVIAELVVPALISSFVPLEVSSDIFS